ncbi:DUF2202 domain-containing protein [Hyunsoonleella flava]|uniref:DUF2202 domain-containing protein n=1 Tax=Hyunsoonleella flava TaxID=2527939 RepID=A0A4Q9FBZ2_9FLAO|nr:DUF2202 domain-containing protein [Hyunsoonleella flava]TBN00409.1 DUF2202 domain-containing protein [Hyunsoonleella flava]
MRNSVLNQLATIAILFISFAFFNGCSDNDEINDIVNEGINNNTPNDTPKEILTAADKAALLFMLEEEKLARDTYIYLNDLWAINQFANITKSEQTHMDAIANLLTQNKIQYTVLPVGEFKNQDLQNLYNQFVINGKVDKINAFKIGATIEDLDIVDLQNLMDASQNTDMISIFKSLQCGSRNHLRSFIKGLDNIGGTYSPQFLTQTEFDTIVSARNEKCN